MLEAYAVAVRVRLIDGVTSGLMGLSSAFARAHGNAATLQKQLDGIRFKLAAGGALLGAGALGFMLIDKAVKPAEEYAHQLNIMKMAGMSNLDIAQATAAAWKNTGTVITTTATGNLRAILDLKNILGSMQDAKWALPIVTKVGAVMASSSESKIANNASDIAFSMAKALDIIGAARDPGTFAREAGLMSKVVTAFQNRVTPKQFQGVFQYARQAKFDLSDEFKYEFLPSLMLEMSSGNASGGGGSRGVGPMLAAIYRVTNQGYINKKSVPLWEQLGLIKPGTALNTSTTGTVTAPLKDRTLAAQNPFLFATKILEPAIRARFGQNIGISREREIVGELFRGNQLAASAMMEFISKPQNYLRDQQIIRGAMPYDRAYNQAQKNDPAFQWAALHAQYENALIGLGVAALPLVIRGIRALSQTIQPLGAWLISHPNLTSGLVIGFTALSAAMAFGGTVILLTAAFDAMALALPVLEAGIGLISWPILAVGAAVAAVGFGIYELVKHWQEIPWAAIGKYAAMALGGALLGAVAIAMWPISLVVAGFAALGFAGYELVKHWDQIRDGLGKVWAGIASGVSKFVASIWDAFKGMGAGIWNWIKAGGPFGHTNLKKTDAAPFGFSLGLLPTPPGQERHFAGGMPSRGGLPPGVAMPKAPGMGATATKSAAPPVRFSATTGPSSTRPSAPARASQAAVTKEDLADAIMMAAQKLVGGLKLVMDGQVVGQIVASHEGARASRPSTGPSTFDTHLSQLRPDMAF